MNKRNHPVINLRGRKAIEAAKGGATLYVHNQQHGWVPSTNPQRVFKESERMTDYAVDVLYGVSV